MKWFRDIGPGVLIAAAFIGPGTVTLCTIAGASFGYSLIWAIILSIFLVKNNLLTINTITGMPKTFFKTLFGNLFEPVLA